MSSTSSSPSCSAGGGSGGASAAGGGQFTVGAGVLPFAITKKKKKKGDAEGEQDEEERTWVLLHKMFQGNKVGMLVDFGGAFDSTLDRDPLECAAREFAEETAGLLWPSSSSAPSLLKLRSFATRDELYGSEEVALAKRRTEEFLRHGFTTTNAGSDGSSGSDSCCLSVHPVSRYHCYVLPIDWRDARELNEAFSSASLYKRRELLWIPVEELLNNNDATAPSAYSLLHPRIQTDDMRRILASLLRSQSLSSSSSSSSPSSSSSSRL